MAESSAYLMGNDGTMVRLKLNGLAICILAASCAIARGASLPASSPNAELLGVTERGRLLAEYDSAASHATDAVLATHPKEGTSNRYIAHKTGAGWVVDFGKLDATGGNFMVSSEATQAGG